MVKVMGGVTFRKGFLRNTSGRIAFAGSASNDAFSLLFRLTFESDCNCLSLV